MMDNELKKKFAAFIKSQLTSDSISEEDIVWIMDECDKGNKPTYEDFVKARRKPKIIEPKDICCKNCKNSTLSFDEEPCKNCLEFDTDQPMAYKHPCFEKKDIVDARDRSMDFGPNMMRQEEFKIPDSIKMIIDQNMRPSIVFPQLDGIERKVNNTRDNSGHIRATTEHTDSVVVGITKTVRDIESICNTIKSHQINLEKANHAIEEKIDKLTEALESVNTKLDILDQRMHDLRQHQILKDMKCITQVKEAEKDIPSMAKEPPKFQVGDIVKVTNDSRNNDFFVCRIKWSERSKRWNYLISLDLEDISRAFWRMEQWLTKSEDHSEPLFKVGDKVKLKHGKTVYEVYYITHFICNKKKVYRYKIGHKATTPHYENENRLIKA